MIRASLLDELEGAAGGQATRPELDAELAGALAEVAPEPPWPTDLVGRRCPVSAAEWHRAHLARPASPARRAYHARWLLHLLDPDDARRLPRVSVIVPVFNRAALVAEAIASALASTHRSVEVILVDDGSTDDLARAIEPFRGRITVLSQPNRGVAAARNAGVARATGEFLHFLDSDNLIEADALERFVAAFRCIADAELCYAPPRVSGEEHPGLERFEFDAPDGGPECPTTDLMAAFVRRHPFATVGVLLPRWLYPEAGPQDEGLRRGEDTRYWFRLAARGTKVVGLARRMNMRRRTPGSLSNDPEELARTTAEVWLLNAAELLRRPALWRHLGVYASRMLAEPAWRRLDGDAGAAPGESRRAVLEEVRRLGDGARREGLSPAPVLGLCREAARAVASRRAASNGGFVERLAEAAREGLRHAPPIEASDLTYWLEEMPERLADNRGAVLELFAAVDRSVAAGAPLVSLSRLARLAEMLPDHPWRARWRWLARLTPRLGAGGARFVVKACVDPLVFGGRALRAVGRIPGRARRRLRR